MNGTIGEIRGFAGNFAPRTWAFCQGQLLAISANTALFSILGTTYGGDGVNTFALPDLRGRAPLQQGTGPGLNDVALGERGGGEQVTLNQLTMPNHTHFASMHVRREDGLSKNPTNSYLATDQTVSIYSSSAPDVQLGSETITVDNTGNGQPFSIRNPYLGLNMIICMFGVYPSRS